MCALLFTGGQMLHSAEKRATYQTLRSLNGSSEYVLAAVELCKYRHPKHEKLNRSKSAVEKENRKRNELNSKPKKWTRSK